MQGRHSSAESSIRPNERENATTASFPSVRYAWLVLAILLIVYTYSFIDRQILSLLVEPIKTQLRISDTGLGILQGTSFALFFSILGIPIGLLADRSNRRNLIIAGLLLWSLATALCGAANSFWGLFAGRVAVGVGEACLAPAAYSMISDYFRPSQRGRALTVYTSGVYLGAGLAFVVGGSVISLAQRGARLLHTFGMQLASWQAVFVLIGCAGVVLAPIVLLIREPTRQERLTNGGARVGLREALLFLKSRAAFFGPLMGALSCVPIVNYAFFSWTPTMLQRQHHWAPQSTGYAFGALLMTLGPLGMIAAGFVTDAFGRPQSERFAVWVAAVGTAAVVPFGVLAGLSTTSTGALLGLAGVVLFMALPVTMAPFIIQGVLPNEFRGVAISIYVLIANLTGFGLGPTTAALISDRLLGGTAGIGRAMALMSAVLLPLAVLLFIKAAINLPRTSAARGLR